jgi:hypothetical protein
MSQCASEYPVSQFLVRIMQERGFSPAEFIQSLGYRSIERGLRRLQPWVEQGHGFDKIMKQITASYPGYAEELGNAILETKAVMHAEFEVEWRERCKAEAGTFRPHIHADGEKTVPSQICTFGMTGGHGRWTTIPIPQNILDLPDDYQLAALAELMEGYRLTYKGQVPFFGPLKGFKFVRLLDYFRFDKDGQFVERVDRPFRSSPCAVWLR